MERRQAHLCIHNVYQGVWRHTLHDTTEFEDGLWHVYWRMFVHINHLGILVVGLVYSKECVEILKWKLGSVSHLCIVGKETNSLVEGYSLYTSTLTSRYLLVTCGSDIRCTGEVQWAKEIVLGRYTLWSMVMQEYCVSDEGYEIFVKDIGWPKL